MLLERLVATPCIHSLSTLQARLIGAARHWVIAGKLGRCQMAAAHARTGSARAGAHLHLLMEEIGALWPDPFCVAPPCAGRLSHDEALLAAMIDAAAGGDRAGFDRLLADLIAADGRERLYLSAGVLARLVDRESATL